MHKVTVLLFSLTLMFSTAAHSVEIGGITMPDTMPTPISGTDSGALHLNGAGIREKFFIDLYVGALYLQSKQSDARQIMQAQEPMAIRLHILSNLITSEKMVAATEEGFEHSTEGKLAPIQTKIDQLLAAFKQPIKAGDIFDFVYMPGTGVKIIKNGTLADTITDEDGFKAALFGIWICDKPAQKSLRKEMLGMKS